MDTFTSRKHEKNTKVEPNQMNQSLKKMRFILILTNP